MRHYSSLRLMGWAVSWQKGTTDYTEITLDDGTGLMVIHVPQYMIQKCQSSAHETFLGKSLDCIVRVEYPLPPQQQPEFILKAEQIAIHDDDPHAELVRWFELSWQQRQENEFSNHNFSMENGFPLPKLTPEDFLEIIQLECSANADGRNPSAGVAMEDLALFFQLDQGTVEEFLAELQISGQIYQNQQGNYLPL